MLAPTLLALALAAEGPSFDCAKARAADEKLVCADGDLAKQDRELAQRYAAALAADPARAPELKAAQRAWLAERASCTRARAPDALRRCVTTSYEWRVADFTAPRPAAKLPDGIVERRIVRRDPLTEGEVDAAYPALAPGRPGAAAFDAFFAKDAQSRIAGWRKEPREDVDGGSSFHASFTVPLTTPRFVTVVTTGDTYERGAAHPLPFRVATTFDLERGRPVALADVFSRGAKVADALAPTVVERLEKELEELDDAQRKAARAELAKASTWTFTADAAIVTFEPYSVAPYAAGSPEVRFTWAELRPHLRADSPLPPR